jgi:hypothetical protein
MQILRPDMWPEKPFVTVDGPKDFTLRRDYVYWWAKEKFPVQRLVVRAPFVFDYASVPRAFHFFVNRLELGLVAPLLHDGLYRCGGDIDRVDYIEHDFLNEDTSQWEPANHVWSRTQADKLMGRIMREEHIARWRRRGAYLAIRVGGHGAFRS